MISPLEEIKNKLEVVEIISQYLKLEKAGANYKALCPFHKEKTPSFFVSPSRQIWHCFGCGAGGDVFSFVSKMENIEFKETIKILAEKAGVKLFYESPEIQAQKKKIIEINKEAGDFFQRQLASNAEAGAYLEKRGLKKETIKEFKLGWAPDDWRLLLNYLTSRGYKPEEISGAGLVVLKEESLSIGTRNYKYQSNLNNYYDRFRARIMFPIEDASGNLVGFTGRIFQGKNPLKTIKNIETVGKYVNTPQTIVFDKSKILYGLSKTKSHLFSAGATLMVEGQMDFLLGWQSGIKNIVATSGTSSTAYHLTILKRYSNNLILGFDMDEAGEKAAERSIDLALAKEFNIKVLRLPKEKDLAEYLSGIKEEKEVKELIDNAAPIMDFYWERAKAVAEPNNLEGKKAVASYFLTKVKKLVNPLDRVFWLDKLSQYLNIERRALEDEIQRISLEKPKTIIDENEPQYEFASLEAISKSRQEILAERIIAFMIKDPSFKKEAEEYKKHFPPQVSELLKIVMVSNSQEDLTPDDLRRMNLEEETIKTINELALRADYETEMLEKFNVNMKEEFKKQLKDLKNEAIKIELKRIESEISAFEKNGRKDSGRLKELLGDFNRLVKELN